MSPRNSANTHWRVVFRSSSYWSISVKIVSQYVCSVNLQISLLNLTPKKFLTQSFPLPSLCLGSITLSLSQSLGNPAALWTDSGYIIYLERMWIKTRNAPQKNAISLFPWNTTIHNNCIPASITAPAGLGWALPWSVTSSSCWSPQQGIIARPIVRDTKKQARQNASGNKKMLSNMMRIQDDQAWSRSKQHWLVAPSLEGPLIWIRSGKTKKALQQPMWIQMAARCSHFWIV